MTETPYPNFESQRLRLIFNQAGENASRALAKWIGRPVTLKIGDLRRVPLELAVQAIGPGETLVVACMMELSGALDGLILLVFKDQEGLALVDLLLRQPTGTARSWGELEQSAARETANILGCAYVNAIASEFPGEGSPLVPGPPQFRHEFAASLLEFALIDQATHSDEALLVSTEFQAGGDPLHWSLLFVPGSKSMTTLSRLSSH